jgi:hypothetical protein
MNRRFLQARRSVDAIQERNRSILSPFVARQQLQSPHASTQPAVIDLTNDSDADDDMDLYSADDDDVPSRSTEKRCNIQECKTGGKAPRLRTASIQEGKNDVSANVGDPSLWKKPRPFAESVVARRLTSGGDPHEGRNEAQGPQEPSGHAFLNEASDPIATDPMEEEEEGEITILLNPQDPSGPVVTIARAAAAPKEPALPLHREALVVPTMQDLVTQCWTCGVSLRGNIDEKDRNACPYYAMHSHVVLGGTHSTIPMCSVCAEDIAALEQQEPSDLDPSSYCSGCGVSEEDYGDVFFLCDNTTDDCVRAFCFHCVAKCCGGGRKGIVAAHYLSLEEDAPWYCPACRPPPELLKLQEQVTFFGEQQESKIVRDLECLLGQLSGAEEEKKRCESELLPQFMEIKKMELRRSIQEDARKVILEDKELDELVQVAFDLWYEDWVNHDKRLSDFISGLLDELETEHEFTAAMCYQAIGMVDISEQKEKTESAAPNEAWIRAADLEVERRIQERRGQVERNILSDDKYEADFFTDVEDLGTGTIPEGNETSEDAEILALRPGFSSKLQRPSSQRLQEAMSNEDALQVAVQTYVGDDQDQQILLQEKKNAVMGSKSRFYIRNEFRAFSKSQRRNSSGQRKRSATAVLREPSEPQATPTCQSEFASSVVHREVSTENEGVPMNDSPDSTLNNVARQLLQEYAPSDVSKKQAISDDQQDDYGTQDATDNPNDMSGIAEFSPDTYRISQQVSEQIVEQVLQGTKVVGGRAFNVMRGSDSQNEVISVASSSESQKNVSTRVIGATLDSDDSRLAMDEHDSALDSKMPSETNSKKVAKGRKVNTPDSKRSPRKVLKRKVAIAVYSSNKAGMLREIVVPVNTPGKRRKKMTSPSPNGQSAISILSSIADNDPPVAVSDKELVDDGTEIQRIVLCSLSDPPNSDGIQPIRTIRVNQKLSKHLKPHQVEGVKFMWRNCFSDFAFHPQGRPDQIGGCILAHNMGLVSVLFRKVSPLLPFTNDVLNLVLFFLLQGKSLSTIALLHTVWTTNPEPLVKKILLVVPVNTLANWENGTMLMGFLDT